MIEVRGLGIRQGDFRLDGVNLTIPHGAYGVLMGRSGCGKTTILEAVCGLRKPTAGQIRFNGTEVTHLKPGERGLGYVPQDRALFPDLTVYQQLAFALQIQKRAREEIEERVQEMAELLGIHELLERTPESLSGGEAQRVALGRALSSHPSVLCLDEPLSALDEETHEETCDLLASIHEKTGVTVFHITHSPTEARRLATCLLRLEDGQITVLPTRPRDSD